MHYLTIKNIAPGMMLAKSIIGDDGKIFIREQNKLTEANLTRIKEMGFQGAYIEPRVRRIDKFLSVCCKAERKQKDKDAYC